MLLIDEAWAKADPARAKAAGYSGIIGYISEDNTGKNLTRPQIDAIHAQGMDVGFADEYNAKEALGGSSTGMLRAQKTVGFATALGIPKGVGFYAPADWDVTDSQKLSVLYYAQAHDNYLRSYGYRGGLYSGYWTVKYLKENGYAGLLWQTYAWSGGLWLDGVAIRQEANGIIVAGANVDRDETEVIDWGQWSPGGNTMASGGDPITWDIPNIYAYLFEGGPSCGDIVPAEFRATQDTTGNALPSQVTALLRGQKALSEALSALPQAGTGISQDMVNQGFLFALSQPAVIQALATSIASHFKVD